MFRIVTHIHLSKILVIAETDAHDVKKLKRELLEKEDISVTDRIAIINEGLYKAKISKQETKVLLPLRFFLKSVV